MATRSMNYLRKNAKIVIVVMGVILMVTFVVGDALMNLVGTGPVGGTDPVVVTWTKGSVREGDLHRMRVGHRVSYHFLYAVIQEALNRGGSPMVGGRQLSQGQPIQFVGIPADDSDEALIQTMLLAQEAERMGIVVDDAAVNAFLKQISGPELAGGDWLEIANSVLGDSGMTVGQLFEHLAHELQAQHVRVLAQAGLYAVPPGVLWDYFNRLNRRATIEAFPIEAEAFMDQVKGEPTESELKTLFEEGRLRDPDPTQAEPGFHRPHRVAFSWLRVDFEPFLQQAMQQITDEQVEARYKQDISQGLHKVAELPEASDTSAPPQTPATDEAAPTEPSATDAPAADAPATDTPAADKPATDTPAADAPAATTPEPQADARAAPDAAPTPNSGDDASSDQPEPEAAQDGAAQDGCQDEQPAAEEPAPPAEAEKPAEEPAAADAPPANPPSSEQAAAETPATETEPAEQPASAAPVTEAPATEAPGAENSTTPSEPKFKPLEEVRDDIRKQLAQPIAQEARDKAMKEVMDEINNFGQRYRRWRSLQESKIKTSATDPGKLDLAAIAARHGFEFGETPLVDRHQVREYEIGQKVSVFDIEGARMGQFRSFSFADLAFGENEPLFRAQQAESSEPDSLYIFYRTDEQPAAELTFEEAREDVLKAWKRQKAFELALAEAQKLADKAKGVESLTKVVPDPARVLTPPPFSWLTTGSLAFGFGEPQLSFVDGVELAGREFMEAVFSLQPGEVGVAPNQAHTAVYLVRVIGQQPDEEILRQQFLESGLNFQILTVAQREVMQISMDWYRGLEEQYKVTWLRPPAQSRSM